MASSAYQGANITSIERMIRALQNHRTRKRSAKERKAEGRSRHDRDLGMRGSSETWAKRNLGNTRKTVLHLLSLPLSPARFIDHKDQGTGCVARPREFRTETEGSSISLSPFSTPATRSLRDRGALLLLVKLINNASVDSGARRDTTSQRRPEADRSCTCRRAESLIRRWHTRARVSEIVRWLLRGCSSCREPLASRKSHPKECKTHPPLLRF